ncbi:MAG: hypothetical protein IPN76_08145 [Saprospiraceae bacterium]|nr:hypothetical protein [Saprospiraceae bacterium]
MKKREGYEFYFNEDRTEFRFESVGPKGTIIKMVRFKAVEENLFSLAFGDKDSDDFDDEIISDNGDMRKVVQTLVNVVHFFTVTNPAIRIVIWPVDRKRKLLYNRIFQQFESEILEYYSIEGYTFNPRSKEFFDTRKIYDAFVLIPEKPIFETH